MVETKRRSPRKPVRVTKPVEAFVGPIEARLMAYDTVQVAVDDIDERPWAWVAMCRVTLRIDGLTCTKKLKGRYRYVDRLGWARPERPSEIDLGLGLDSVVGQVRLGLARLGLEDAPVEVNVHGLLGVGRG